MFSSRLLSEILLDSILGFLVLTIGALFILALLFAATAILLRRRHSQKARRRARLEEKWNPLVTGILAGEGESSRLLEAVAVEDRLFFIHFLLRWKRRVKGPSERIFDELARPFLPEIAERLAHGDAERRARAAHTLGILGGEEYLPVIRGALDDSAPLVAMIAARALVRTRRADRILPIIERLDRFQTWGRSYFASLLATGGAAILPALRGILGGEGSDWSRAVAAETLRQMKDLEAARLANEILAEGAREAEGRAVSTDLAATCLRLIETVGGVDDLAVIRLLADGGERIPAVVRASALRTLASLGDASDAERFRHGFEAADNWVAIHAARGLQAVGDSAFLRWIAGSTSPRAMLAREVMGAEVDE